MPSNLPPGVSDSDIPGNRPEDMAWERLHECIDDVISREGMSDMDAWVAWKLGVDAWKAAKANGAKFPRQVAIR